MPTPRLRWFCSDNGLHFRLRLERCVWCSLQTFVPPTQGFRRVRANFRFRTYHLHRPRHPKWVFPQFLPLRQGFGRMHLSSGSCSCLLSKAASIYQWRVPLFPIVMCSVPSRKRSYPTDEDTGPRIFSPLDSRRQWFLHPSLGIRGWLLPLNGGRLCLLQTYSVSKRRRDERAPTQPRWHTIRFLVPLSLRPISGRVPPPLPFRGRLAHRLRLTNAAWQHLQDVTTLFFIDRTFNYLFFVLLSTVNMKSSTDPYTTSAIGYDKTMWTCSSATWSANFG